MKPHRFAKTHSHRMRNTNNNITKLGMFVSAVCEVRISIYYFIRQNIDTAENTQTQTNHTYKLHTNTHNHEFYKRGKSKGKIIVLYRPNIEYIIVLIYLE